MTKKEISKREDELKKEVSEYIRKCRRRGERICYFKVKEQIKELVNIHSMYGWYYEKLAKIYEEYSSFKKAIEILREGIKEAPVYIENHLILAEYLKEDGQDEEALIKFKECLKMNFHKEYKEGIQNSIKELEEITK